MEQQRAEHQRRVAEAKEAAAGLLADLHDAGYEVTSSVHELVELGRPYDDVVPLLIDALDRCDDPMVKQDIVRALTVPWARPAAAPALVRQFAEVEDESGIGLRWAIGNALAVVADETVFDEVLALARDRRHGKAREMLMLALAATGSDRAEAALLELLEDEVVAGHAVMALGNLGAKGAHDAIEPFLYHEKAWVRAEARKALRKLSG